MKKETIITGIGIIFIILLAANISASYKNKCLTYGEAVPSLQNPRFTCNSQLCQVCVDDKNYPTHPGYCSRLPSCTPQSSECRDANNNPILTVNSPINNFVYNNRKVEINISSDKMGTFYYLDNINGRGRWSKLTSDSKKYSKGISFKEGPNDITIRIIDVCGKEAEANKIFIIDSKKPKLGKIITDYTGTFKIDFTEDNPSSLIMKFGNNQNGFKSVAFNINEDCIKKTGGKSSCLKTFSYQEYLSVVSSYSNQEIQYWAELTDIVNNAVKTKPQTIFIDITPPLIENPNSMFQVNGKNVNFNIKINEPNFKEADYKDNSNDNPKYLKLCTSLKNGYCAKKLSFSQGTHVVEINILDESNNPTTKTIEFTIE